MPAPNCPYLGLRADRESFVAYPSLMNCCYHTRNTAFINLDYQEGTCLGEAYVRCPVYQSQKRGRLPRVAAAPDYVRQHFLSYWSMRILLSLMAILAAGALFWVLSSSTLLQSWFSKPDPGDIVAYTAPTYQYSIPTVEGYMPGAGGTGENLTPQPTETFLWNTDGTPNIADTEKAMANHPRLKIYQVKNGDNLDALATKFQTTPRAIIDINYTIRIPLFVDEVIIVPEGITDIRSFPRFEARKIQQRSPVAEICRINACSIEQFQQYNESIIITVDEVPTVLEGIWVLIPRPNAANQP